MKIKKTLLAAIALGISVGVTTTSCSKEDIKPQEEVTVGENQELGPDDFNFELIEGTRTPIPPGFQCNCPACGLG